MTVRFKKTKDAPKGNAAGKPKPTPQRDGLGKIAKDLAKQVI
jgi:hypothetical protein